MDKNKITIARGALTFAALLCAICFLPFKKRQTVNLELTKCDCIILPHNTQLSQVSTISRE